MTDKQASVSHLVKLHLAFTSTVLLCVDLLLLGLGM
jgi:hypothetical protein